MLYGVTEVKSKKRKLNYKKVVGVVIMLLLVLGISIRSGMKAAEQKHNEYLLSLSTQGEQKTENIENTESKEQPEEKPEEKKIDEKEIKRRKEHFYKEVDDIYNGKPGVKRVFLTFDDGPSDTVTPYILDILDQYNVKATFFVLGNRVADHKELIQREYNEGHYIGNHSYTHKYNQIYRSPESVLEEYNKTEDAIRKALNNPDYSSNLFRFPGGSIGGPYEDIKSEARKLFKKDHIAFLDWNALTYDAEGADSKQEILKNLKDTMCGRENIVLLMHDAADKELTYETLPDVIEYLRDKGYAFKNMYDLQYKGK